MKLGYNKKNKCQWLKQREENYSNTNGETLSSERQRYIFVLYIQGQSEKYLLSYNIFLDTPKTEFLYFVIAHET